MELTIADPDGQVPALTLFNVLEELRNAGAEAVQLNDLRIIASTYFVDTADGVEVDGVVLDPPYRWVAIGDPDTLVPALEIPGGAMSASAPAAAPGRPAHGTRWRSRRPAASPSRGSRHPSPPTPGEGCTCPSRTP